MGKSRILIFCLLLSLPLGADGIRSKVLLLNSYHKGYLWSDEITRGVEDSLRGRDAELFVEYMDTKRLYQESYLDHLATLYRDKYSHTDFDLVITSDNNAFDFYRSRGEELFGKRPQVFCGYNNLKPEDLQGLTGVTGISEEADIRGNLELIMSLHGDTERIVLVTDDTVTGKRMQEEFRSIRKDPPPGTAELEIYYDTTRDELIQWAMNLPPGTVILMTFFSVDRLGETYRADEVTALLDEYAPVPVYGAWDFNFGRGIVGGILVSGYDQGLRAGNLALQILNGLPPASVPVEYDTPHQMKFDYRRLVKFDIPLSRLPPGAEVLYRPPSFYTRNRRLIWTALVIFFFQTLAILYLISLNRSKKRIQKQLVEQGDLLRLVINHIPHRIFWKNRKLEFLGYNLAFAQSLGIGEEDLKGRTAPPSPADEEEEGILESGIPLLEREERSPGDEGRDRWLQKTRIPIENGGEGVGILGIDTDITERKNYQISMETAERKLRTIIDAVPSQIFVKNGEGRFLMANREMAQALGRSQEEIIGRRQGDLMLSGGEAEEVLGQDREVIESGTPLRGIVHRYDGEGHEPVWWQTTKIPCPVDLFGEPAVLGVSMDITPLKSTEELLKNREEYLRTTMDSIAEGVISTDREGRIVQMNRRAEALIGRSRRQGEGRQSGELIPLRRAGGNPIDPVDEVLRRGRKSRFSGDLLFTDGEEKEHTLSLSCSPIRDSAGETRGAVLVFRDITEEKLIRRQLAHSEKLDTLGQLAGGITHDFNNMLGGIMSAAQLIKPYLLGKETAAGYLELLISTVRKAGDLTKELLLFSRRSDSPAAPFEIIREIEQTVKLLGRTLDKRILITTRLKGEACLVNGDPSRIQSALMNLGINASHAMPDGGTIEVETDLVELDREACEKSPFNLAPGPYIRIRFADGGTGIPEENLVRIFEPFFTTKPEGVGTGLGLSTVFRTVEQHRGSIEVESALGKGTAFTICLPLVSGKITPEEERGVEAVNGTGHILIVDDDPVMRVTGEEILKHLGYRVSLAENGEEGLEFYRDHGKEIDLVLLDMIMPRMNGLDCYVAMKRINPRLRAVLSSGFTTEVDIARLREEGLVHFCRKPYTIAQLHSIIEEAMKSP